MATNPVRGVRVPDEFVTEVYAARPELAGFDLSRLLRAGLVYLAGRSLPEAIEASKGNKRGPAPKAAERERAGAAA
jgi:hypothetical protein